MDIAVWCHDHPLASFRATPCRLRTIARHGYQDVGASKTPLPLRMACTGNRGLTVGSVFSKPRPPLRKPPITSRTVQAKRTRKSSTQKCQSDSEHFCSEQVRLQVASCVSQCPRSSRWASSSCARNSTEGSGSERASESPPRSTPNQGKTSDTNRNSQNCGRGRAWR